MIPVVMLAINTGALSSLLLTLFCLTMTCPSFEYISVIYLMTVTARVIQVFSGDPQMYFLLISIADITQLVYLMFSWFINIFSTSIIALKAWCVRVGCVFEKQFDD
jgi:hypothetical protein